MVWNEKLKREIPEEWKVKSIFEAISVQYGFPFSTEQFTEEITNVQVVRIRDILEGTTSAYSLEDTDEKYRLNEGDVLVGMDGNFHMNFWHNNEAYLNQRCVRLRPYSDSGISSIQILHSISPYIKAKEQSAKGSTVGHLSDKDLKGLCLVQSINTMHFNSRKTLDGLLSLIIRNKKEVLSLTKLRDSLLPLLMNGQVSINYDLASIISQLHDVKKANFANHRGRQVTKFVYICARETCARERRWNFAEKAAHFLSKIVRFSAQVVELSPPLGAEPLPPQQRAPDLRPSRHLTARQPAAHALFIYRAHAVKDSGTRHYK